MKNIFRTVTTTKDVRKGDAVYSDEYTLCGPNGIKGKMSRFVPILGQARPWDLQEQLAKREPIQGNIAVQIVKWACETYPAKMKLFAILSVQSIAQLYHAERAIALEKKLSAEDEMRLSIRDMLDGGLRA